jgi:hypothetical protein
MNRCCLGSWWSSWPCAGEMGQVPPDVLSRVSVGCTACAIHYYIAVYKAGTYTSLYTNSPHLLPYLLLSYSYSSQCTTMGPAPLNNPHGSTFAALRHITPDKQPVSPISRPTSPDVKAIKPPKLSLVMPKPDARGSHSHSPSTPSLSPSSPRISYAQAAGVFSIPTTPTTPSPTTGASVDSHAMIGDTFLLNGAETMNGRPVTSTAKHEPKKPNNQVSTLSP